MQIYLTKDPHMVIAFDKPIEPRPEPIILAGQTIKPGDKITAILGVEHLTSAGFESFQLRKGYITYAGKYTVIEQGIDHPWEAILFTYNYPRDASGLINGHRQVFICWSLSEIDGVNHLFFETKWHAARVIVPGEIKRHF